MVHLQDVIIFLGLNSLHSVLRWDFSHPKQAQKFRSILPDGSRLLGLFWKGKPSDLYILRPF